MKIGLQIPSFTWPGGPSQIAPTLARIGRAAEEAGFASLWVMDHFFQIGMIGKPEEPMLEGYSALSFLASVTERVRLGTLVTGVVYRHPGILVKTATTLDVLSGGRAYLGIGAFHLQPNGTSPRQAIEHCRGLSDAGIQHLIVSLPRVHEITPIEVMAKEVIPAVADF